MSHLTAKEVGERLARAGRLELKPLCVYGADEVPPGVVTVPDVVKAGHRCLAKALLLVAAGEADGVYVGPGAMKGICPGALCWLGLTAFPEDICNDLSTGGDDPLYLKESPACAAWTLKKMGKVASLHRHLVMQACEKAAVARPLSYLCFGSAEQVRDLCGLLHFDADAPFGQIDAPWGSHCATFVAYPAGLTGGAPKHTAFLGPTAPDGNPWFPRDMMALSMPAKIACRMAADVDRSFVVKCAETTFPKKRDAEVMKALTKIR